jgi:predicted nucleic acid-binding protein
VRGRFYVDSSAILRPVLEPGLASEVDSELRGAELLVSSRLSIVETARAFLRVRRLGQLSETAIVDGERWVRGLWRHCQILEISREVCDLAETIAPRSALRSLDAIHVASFVLFRREMTDLRLLTADKRLEDAAGAI